MRDRDLASMLVARHAPAVRGFNATILVDDIEYHVVRDPDGSRRAIWGYRGDETIRSRTLGLAGDAGDLHAELLVLAGGGPRQVRKVESDGELLEVICFRGTRRAVVSPDAERVDRLRGGFSTTRAR